MTTETYKNPPTVVVVLQPVGQREKPGLVVIQRAIPGEGFGKIALPGGYQIEGQTWQEAGAAELEQETGVIVDPDDLVLIDVQTTPDKKRNLLFCLAPRLSEVPEFTHDHEVSKVDVITTPITGAFPLHDEQIAAFFAYPLR